MHRPAAAVLFALAACTAPVPSPTTPPIDEIKIGPETYPIEAGDSGIWRIKIDGHPVTCAQPTRDACYWSARHYLTAQELLDDLG
ncbi:hypothetical protein [Defluviimonas sp. SAOS-178_SWC]|uniref:hypothetical protein n=1 Tax=Defluviimonas sp. SAOS-178_SWC TaxID=3121287 RepID=UPI0032215897